MLGRALKMIRIFHDVSQKDLAKRFDIVPSYLSAIETDKKTPTLPLLEKYSEEFHIPMSSILFFSETLERGSFAESTRVTISRKVLALLNFIAERSGRLSSD
ncbi:MAG TPA: helix-turn-helix transcriptional regulator [Magnetospirillaceae bacterium]